MKRQFYFCVAFALFLMMVSRASLAQEEIFVTSTNSVTVHARTASGNLAPLRSISGPLTGLQGAGRGVVVDRVNNELFVVNHSFPAAVLVFALTANGNVAPLRTISGSITGLSEPTGLALDAVNDELAIVSRSGFRVLVFARTAAGNVAPLRTITSEFPVTGMSNPTGIAIDVVNSELVVANNGGSISVYSRTANGNVPPLRQIIGTNTGFNNGPLDVAVDTVNNELVVTNPSFGPSFLPTVMVFSRTANGNVPPLRNILGSSTGLVSPHGLVVDTVNNELWVANGLDDSVTVYARTATGNVAPLRRMSGSNTLLKSPKYLAISTVSVPASIIIRANGAKGNVTVNYPGTLSLTVQTNAGAYVGIATDWWVVAYANSSWYYLNNVLQWIQFDGNLANCKPVYQGGFDTYPPMQVSNMTGLPVGSYTFWFAVDYPMDGILNLSGQILVDSVNVTVQ